MRRAVSVTKWLMSAALGVGALGALATPAQAVEPYVLSVGILGGIGGPIDAAEGEANIDQSSLELQVNLLTAPRTLFGVRVGRIAFSDDERMGSFVGPDLDYVTLAGEYRTYKDWYDSGIFLGLGGYRLQSSVGDEEETAIGATLGVTGEIEVTRTFGIIGEISSHWADLEDNQFFATVHAGVLFKF